MHTACKSMIYECSGNFNFMVIPYNMIFLIKALKDTLINRLKPEFK